MPVQRLLLIVMVCGQISCSGYVFKKTPPADAVSPVASVHAVKEISAVVPTDNVVAELESSAPRIQPIEPPVHKVNVPELSSATATVAKVIKINEPTKIEKVSSAIDKKKTVSTSSIPTPVVKLSLPAVPKPPIIKKAAIPLPQLKPVQQSAPLIEVAIPIEKIGAVTGKVTLLGKKAEVLLARETIVTLEPLFTLRKIPKPQKTYNIEMQNKHYSPSVLVIHAGDKVMFNNKDSIKHNVFSSSGNNSFDLGTYGRGIKEQVKLAHQGIVKVYCNIHVEMATFIAIDDNSFTYVTKDDGKFMFSDLPIGEYILKVWSVRGEAKKRITVSDNKTSAVDVVVQSVSYEPKAHLNKFGQSYKVKPVLFEDEFY